MRRFLMSAVFLFPLLSRSAVEARPAPNALHIVAGIFAPAVLTASGRASNSVLQAGPVLPIVHSSTYDAMGRLSGIEETATYHAVNIYYWPSIFSSSTQVKAAWKDAATTFPTRKALLTNPCLPAIHVHCVVFTWRQPVAGVTRVIDYQVMRHNSCLLEVASVGTPAAWNAARQVVQGILYNVDRTGAAVLQRVCLGKLSVSIGSLQLLNTSGHSQTSFKVNQPFLLDVSWTVKNLTKTSTATIAFEYDRRVGSRWQKAVSITETVPTTNGQNPYRKLSQISAKGTFRITVTITVSGATPRSSSVIAHVA